MASEWIQLGPVVNLDALSALADTATSTLSVIDPYLNGIVTTLQVVNAFVVEDTNAVKGTLDAAVNAIESTVLDLMNSNAAVTLHFNLVWNPDWGVEQYQNGFLPWTGNGMTGWLLDLVSSARDATDPFRPLTDEDTEVAGVIFVTGMPGGGSLSSLLSIFNAFTDFGDFKQLFQVEELLENANDNLKALLRLGPGAADPLINGNAVKQRVIAGFEDLQGLEPTPGAYPKWLSVPIASLLPAVQDLFYVLRQVTDNLKTASTQGEMVDKLIGALRRRAELLEEAAEKLQGVISVLEGYTEFFNGAYVIVLPAASGGFDNFVSRARGAEGLPDFGPDGIVVGAAAVVTWEDPFDHLEAFWSLLGLKFEEATDEETARKAHLSQVYDEFFP